MILRWVVRQPERVNDHPVFQLCDTVDRGEEVRAKTQTKEPS